MYTGININSIVNYKDPGDSDPNNPTIFKIGALDSFIKTFIEDKTTEFDFDENDPNDNGKMRINIGMRNLMKVKFGLKGLENFIDPATGAALQLQLQKFTISGLSYDVVPDSVLAILPKSVFIGLAGAIDRLGSLSQDEKKI